MCDQLIIHDGHHKDEGNRSHVSEGTFEINKVDIQGLHNKLLAHQLLTAFDGPSVPWLHFKRSIVRTGPRNPFTVRVMLLSPKSNRLTFVLI